ncbi:MAG: hemerythrin domain-containing protein [Ignavibacteriales bacterium]
MEFKIPQPLKLEHEELHAELVKTTKAGGKLGDAAKAVAKILHPHFVKEEEYALPPLGLLPLLAEGKVTSEMGNVLTMTDRLKAELPQMLEEHKAIVAALKNLVDVAKKEKKMEYAYFAEKLILHAQNEEEVLYPTAILIGEYVKLKLNK